MVGFNVGGRVQVGVGIRTVEVFVGTKVGVVGLGGVCKIVLVAVRIMTLPGVNVAIGRGDCTFTL